MLAGRMKVPTKIVSDLEKRRDDLKSWLRDEAPYIAADQKHLDASTPEQAYWHYGYYIAICDVLRLLNDEVERKSCNGGTPT